MKARALHILLFALFLLTAGSCKHPSAIAPAEEGDTLRLKYAALLTIVEYDSLTTVEIADPWNPGSNLHSYVLVPRDRKLPQNLPPKGKATLIRTPVERATLFSTVHAALLHDLGVLSRATALCDYSYLIGDTLKAAIEKLNIANAGQAMLPDVEQIVARKSDALFVSPFQNNTYGILEKTKIPIIECADYMENSALGRAEWVRLYGLLFGCREKADSLFLAVERKYLQWKAKAASAKQRPTLLVDKMLGPVWYLPGGSSTMGRLFADANTDYVFADNAEPGSVSLSFEEAFRLGNDADVWFIKYGSPHNITYASLRADDPRYTSFRPWRERRIYGCNTLATPFFEQEPFHPDRLLRDLVLALHPDISDEQNDELVFIHELE